MSNRGASSAFSPPVRSLPTPAVSGSPGFAAVLSLLLPGLGQIYHGRWVRGILIFVIPIFAVLLTGAFWSAYRRAPPRGGAACPVPVGRRTRLVLWVALGLWIGAVIVQYLANRLWLKGGVVL